MGRAIAMTAPSDAELLEASRRGEHAAFGALVERYQAVVCAVTYSRTRDQALSEDVAQDTFLAAWRQLDQLREPSRLRAWLCGIAKHLASKTRRQRGREVPVEAALPLTADDDPFAAISQAQSERLVSDALGRVPESYRDVLVLYYREGRSAREVADALGISEPAVLQRLARGRQCLADGVTALVERSLSATRLPRRDLAAIVVASLPFVVPSRVEAATHSTGGSMLKLALAAALFGAAGTTAYAVHASRTTDAPVAVATTPDLAIVAPRAAAPAAPSAAPRGPTLPSTTAAPASVVETHRAPDALPPVEAATLTRLALHDGPSRGAADAPVTIAVFTDLACTYCGQALGTLDQLLDEYPGQLRIVVKQMPVKESSKRLAEAVLAAEAQGKFWELHDLMLAHQDELDRDKLLALATQAGLDLPRFRAALEGQTYAAAVQADLAAAQELELTGAPSLVIGRQRVVGFRSAPELRAMVDAALVEARQ